MLQQLCGVVVGFGILLAVCLLAGFSLHLLTEIAEVLQLSSRASYREISYRAFGTAGVVVSGLVVITTCFGILASYLVIVGDSLVEPIALAADADPDFVRTVLLICTAVMLVPLACLRYLNHLRYASVVAVVASFFFLVCLIVRSTEEIADGGLENCENTERGCVVLADWSTTILRAIRTRSIAVCLANCFLALLCFSFTCQTNFFSTYEELAAPSPRRIRKVYSRY